MSYPFAQSYTDLGLRRGPASGFLVHMAEGGGTVGYLAKANPNGVSVHYVIEYSGRIVQMLLESHMHSSLRTSAIRTTNDANGFGAAAARAVLGDWATTARTLGPNHATIGLEIEGFAADGPNQAQIAALIQLAADVRSRHSSTMRGNLGHRDFADYKSCPGLLIPWAAMGGHGLYTTTPAPTPAPPEDPAMPRILHSTPASGTFTTRPEGAVSFRVSDGADGAVGPGEPQRVVLAGDLEGVLADALFTKGPQPDEELYAFPRSHGTFVADQAGSVDEQTIRKAERARIAAAEAARISGL